MTVSGVLPVLDRLPAMSDLVAALASNETPEPLFLPPSARPAVLSKLLLERNRPLVLITGRVDGVGRWLQALEMWLPDQFKAHRFPEPTPLPYDRGPWSSRTRRGRIEVLSMLVAGQHPQIPRLSQPALIVTSARALLQKTLSKRRFITSTRVLRLGQMINLERNVATWRAIGYEPVSVVESPGQFSRRGGILDIYPITSSYPVRIELFGDEIDTMRHFEPSTQRSIEAGEGGEVEVVVVAPAREALPGVAGEYAQSLDDVHTPEMGELPSWKDDIPRLRAGEPFENLEFYLPLLNPRPASLLDYLPNDASVIVDDWAGLVKAAEELQDHADQIANEQFSLPPEFPSPLFEWQTFEGELSWWQPLILGAGIEDAGSSGDLKPLADAFESGPRYGGQVRPLMSQLKSSAREGERVVVVSQQASRLAELWRREHLGAAGRRADGDGLGVGAIKDFAADQSPLVMSVPIAARQNLPLDSLRDLPDAGTITFVQGSLREGFTLVQRLSNEVLLVLLTDAELFGWSRPAPRRWRSQHPIAPEAHFGDLKAGDFVVHLEYGIGRFEGLVVRSAGGMAREYLFVKYANGDVLYVPVHHADRMSKWIGPDDREPRMHRIGEKNWSKAKAKAQRAADELAGELLDLYAARETVPGHAFAPDAEWQLELEASFPYRETEDQLRVIAEVKADMERPQPMDRLVCGDVGYGKTEVALRAAFKSVLDGKQVAILVPTTVLAQQHFFTFRDRLMPFPVAVDMLSRFRTQSQQDRIVTGLRDGKVDIVVGTHRLLSDDVTFKDLGLVVIDEEQRFGVAHKEKLKSWRTEVDVLTMTATPIPRTLHMSLTGVRDISVIDTAPADRLPVQTYVGEVDDTRLKRSILRELDRGGQLFFVHNRVQTIDLVYNRLRQLVPEAVIAIGHGQMNERHLERIMNEFAEGKIDVLLSTTIIESGLDFPNANTLIVDRAEMFGLSQLYQLRGRVGRGVRRAYAYFFHRPWRTLTPEAKARLETIAEQTHLGAGYQIAMRDMEIRGAGDLLGPQQSGQMASVGFDLYTRLLANAVKRRKALLRGEKPPDEIPEATLIDLPLATFVPIEYVQEPALRLRLYRRMALMDSLADIDEMAEELADRFGPIPDQVHNLLFQLRVKCLAQKAGVTAVTSDNGQIRIRLPRLNQHNRYQVQRYLGHTVRVSRSAIWFERTLQIQEWQVALVQSLERLQTFSWESFAHS